MSKYKLIIVLSFLSSYVINAQLFNKGEMCISDNSNNTTIYIKGDIQAESSSTIKHTGKTVLGGDFINNVTSGHVFASAGTGKFEFKGNSAQYIRGTADKAANYIEFPANVTVNNINTVTLDPLMGATVTDMSLYGGRFIIDSEVSGDKTDVAHLLVKGTIDYVRENSLDSRENDGIIQVNLAMGDNWRNGHLIGFSSPFETMYADYFFFNFLSKPNSETFFAGNRDVWVTDPFATLSAGRGYVIGQGIVPHESPHNQPGGYYYTHKNTAYDNAVYADVAKERFVFARLFAPTSLTQFVRNEASISEEKKYWEERLNTSDVTVSITEGFNYLGNPFTTPLNLKKFVTNPNSGTWGTFSTGEIEPKFYILTPGSKGTYLSNNETFTFTTSYLVRQATGSTAPSDVLAPMQMFAIKKKGTIANTFKINAGERTHGTTQFLRSDEPAEIDELLIETKDNETGGFDRICVVFRGDASLKGTDLYDAEKLFNTTGGVNQIYTRSSDNMKLTTNVLPSTTNRLSMYFDPSDTEQEVTLTADRINSLQSVNQVVLEDTKTGQKTDLTVTPSYSFTSSPLDKADRFVLHFRTTPTSIDEIASESVPKAYYHSGTIYITGLRDIDLGQVVSVYNMHGQLLLQQKVTEINPCAISKSLNTGVYLIRIDKNPYVVKLLVNQ